MTSWFNLSKSVFFKYPYEYISGWENGIEFTSDSLTLYKIYSN